MLRMLSFFIESDGYKKHSVKFKLKCVLDLGAFLGILGLNKEKKTNKVIIVKGTISRICFQYIFETTVFF